MQHLADSFCCNLTLVGYRLEACCPCGLRQKVYIRAQIVQITYFLHQLFRYWKSNDSIERALTDIGTEWQRSCFSFKSSHLLTSITYRNWGTHFLVIRKRLSATGVIDYMLNPTSKFLKLFNLIILIKRMKYQRLASIDKFFRNPRRASFSIGVTPCMCIANTQGDSAFP